MLRFGLVTEVTAIRSILRALIPVQLLNGLASTEPELPDMRLGMLMLVTIAQCIVASTRRPHPCLVISEHYNIFFFFWGTHKRDYSQNMGICR